MAPVKLTAGHLAEITGGALHGPDVTVVGAGIDSRLIEQGALFVPVVAGRDGHRFIDDALAAGAAAYLTARRPGAGTAVAVDDTVAALTELGRWARTRIEGPVVGVTGSAGKTSTKDLLGSVLERVLPTVVSERSFNNELGVPLTLVNGNDGTRAAVIEMGARGAGHIAWLCDIARPDLGVVTNVSAAHTELFGTVDAVADAKGELIAALPPSGTALLNADDDRVLAMARRTTATVLTFGIAAGDVRAVDPVVDGELRVSFRLVSPWGEVDVRLGVRGRHQAGNAAAAAAAALAVGVSLDDVASGLSSAASSPWRMEVTPTPRGVLLINDAYNANPASTEAALRALASVPARHRVAVLGPMLELGSLSEGEHRRVAALAASLGIDVISVGAAEYGVENVEAVEDALARLGSLGEGDAGLVKASRAAGLERVAARLAEGAGGARLAGGAGGTEGAVW
ncbi:MAG: UDP-N-acetylmuramoyl-tripeptide--D-alanyl-D-alanine ligase [Acidimicrobiia bacterium]|nr:UDP-N-acetylmuramoyl-tripeptide--D-alanyl-D-alanine ligase [Acidimicrobiia bacterium]